MPTDLLNIAQVSGTESWNIFANIFKLTTTMPKIILNNRLKSTAGRCDYTTRIIDLSTSMFAENIPEFKRVIIPHELAHAVAWDKYKDSGHGPDWKYVMERFGLPPDRCHDLNSTVLTESRKGRTHTVESQKLAENFIVGDRVTFIHRNRAKVETDIIGTVSKINLKTIKVIRDIDRLEWTVPKLNTCNLRYL